MRKLFIILSTLILGVLFTSCSTSVPQKLDPLIYYKRDMAIKVNGFQGEGVMVVPKAKEYKIEIEAKGDLDLFTFNTCHREWTKEDAWKDKWIFSKKRKVELSYIPIEEVETGAACPAQFGGFERVDGRHSWAHLDFEGDDATLPALVKCNGTEFNSRGVTVCQSKEGLVQMVIFPVPVFYSEKTTRPNCPVLRPEPDEMTLRFETPNRECVYRFIEKDGEGRMHRLTTIGYEKILIREN